MSKYRVITTFCDNVVQEHVHEVLINSTTEYADKLAEAIEPTMEHPKARHIRIIEFQVITDDEAGTIRKVGSPVFPCADRP